MSTSTWPVYHQASFSTTCVRFQPRLSSLTPDLLWLYCRWTRDSTLLSVCTLISLVPFQMPGVIRSSDLTNEEPDTQGKCDVLMPTNTSCLVNWHACFKTASYFPYFPHALRAKCLSISQSWFTFYSTPPPSTTSSSSSSQLLSMSVSAQERSSYHQTGCVFRTLRGMPLQKMEGGLHRGWLFYQKSQILRVRIKSGIWSPIPKSVLSLISDCFSVAY